jgi:hypothetical protein
MSSQCLVFTTHGESFADLMAAIIASPSAISAQYQPDECGATRNPKRHLRGESITVNVCGARTAFRSGL